MSPDLDDRQTRLAILTLVSATIVVCGVLLVVDLVVDFLPHDASAALAGFVGGIVGMFAYALARWVAGDPPRSSQSDRTVPPGTATPRNP